MSAQDKMTIMEDIYGIVKCPTECNSYTDYIHIDNGELSTGHHDEIMSKHLVLYAQ